MIKHYRYNIYGLLAMYIGFAYAYDEGTYADYKQMQADRAEMIATERAAQKKIKKNAWARWIITKPLKAKVREQLTPTVEFLDQKIKEKEPKVAVDRTAYGHIQRMNKNNPTYAEWHKKVKENASYAAANPIVLESDVPEYKVHLGRHVSNLAYDERKLYQEEQALKKQLQGLPWYTSRMHKEALQDRLTYVRHQLEGVDTERTLMPMYKAQMHMRAQDVRQKNLDTFKKDIEHPTDRFINTSAFEEARKLSYGAPARSDHLHKFNPDEMIDYYRAKIHHADQSGMSWLYGAMDRELAKRVYHGSDKLLEDEMNKSDGRFYPSYWQLRRNQWNNELQRLESKKQKRKRFNTPKVQKSWYANMLEKLNL
jgi:hypothetical protein